jgi:hypothetical protein
VREEILREDGVEEYIMRSLISTLSNKYCEIRHYKQVGGMCSIQGAGSDIHTKKYSGDHLGELIASRWGNNIKKLLKDVDYKRME